LEPQDHVTFHPGDFTDGNVDWAAEGKVTIPEDVFVTILPGARFDYDDIETTNLQQRYEYLDGFIENVADLNLDSEQAFKVDLEGQGSRIRIYSQDVTTSGGLIRPFTETKTLDEAAEVAEAGDTIVVFPGDFFPTKNLFKNGVTWNFLAGSRVFYDHEFGSGEYPSALFDDSRTVDREEDQNVMSGAVKGQGEFWINPAKYPATDEAVQTGGDWEGWNLYSIFASTKQDTEFAFEADKVVMDEYADSAFKISGGGKLTFDVRQVVIKDTVKDPNGTVPLDVSTGVIPSVFVSTGYNSGSNLPFVQDQSSNDVKINVEELVIEGNANPSSYFWVSVDPTNAADNLDVQWEGNVLISINDTEIETPQNGAVSLFTFTTNTSPRSIRIEDTNVLGNHSALDFHNSSATNCVVSLKNCVFDGRGHINSPIIVEDPFIDLQLDSVRLLAGTNQYSIEDRTGLSNWEGQIKVFGSSFADKPVENQNANLNDELYQIVVTEDVASIVP
jgi:hypothetical protein